MYVYKNPFQFNSAFVWIYQQIYNWYDHEYSFELVQALYWIGDQLQLFPLHMASANQRLLCICFGSGLQGFGNNLKQRPTSPSIVTQYCHQHNHFKSKENGRMDVIVYWTFIWEHQHFIEQFYTAGNIGFILTLSWTTRWLSAPSRNREPGRCSPSSSSSPSPAPIPPSQRAGRGTRGVARPASSAGPRPGRRGRPASRGSLGERVLDNSGQQLELLDWKLEKRRQGRISRS